MMFSESATPAQPASEMAQTLRQHDEEPSPTTSGGHPTSLRYSWRLDTHPTPVRQARRIVLDTLTRWGVSECGDDVALLVSEMTTNALRHGAPPVTLALALVIEETSYRRLLIEVSDANPTKPEKRNPGERGGFGLSVMESLAELSVEPYSKGKTIRALLRLS
jgi:anti-sigma regulatory factor (Ser/Thr protein kinase)